MPCVLSVGANVLALVCAASVSAAAAGLHVRPNSAAVHPLSLLAGHGAALRYHDNLDGEGIRIAAYVISKVPVTHLARDRSRLPHGPLPQPARPRSGTLATAPWAPSHTAAMAEHGRAVLEERGADLRGPGSDRGSAGPVPDV